MNCYEVLEIQENASEEVVRMAYKALVKKYHPDTFQGDKTIAERKMQAINLAYETLADPDKRKVYDKILREKRNNPHTTNEDNDDQNAQSLSRKDVTYADNKKSGNIGCMGCFTNILGTIFWIVVIVLVVRACKNNDATNNIDQTQNDTPSQFELSDQEKQIRGLYDEYYPVYVIIDYDENILFNKDVELDLYIDGEEIGKIDQGRTNIYGIILQKGEHTFKASASFLNSDSKSFNVGPDPYYEGAYNFLLVKVRHKQGNVEIYNFTGSTMELAADLSTNLHHHVSSMLVLSKPTSVNEFDVVVNQYKCRQINDVRSLKHISEDTDQWSWIRNAITFNLPRGATAEFLTVEELGESALNASAVRIQQDAYTANFTIGIVPDGMSADTIQIFDVYTEMDIEALIADDSKQVIDNVCVETVMCGELQVYEVGYTITNSEGVSMGYSYIFMAKSVFGKMDIESADVELLQMIAESIRIEGVCPHVISLNVNS